MVLKLKPDLIQYFGGVWIDLLVLVGVLPDFKWPGELAVNESSGCDILDPGVPANRDEGQPHRKNNLIPVHQCRWGLMHTHHDRRRCYRCHAAGQRVKSHHLIQRGSNLKSMSV